jgi:ATP-binding cassette subfamily B protein
LGLFAYGAQKLLPLFQQIYSSIATINGAHVSIEDALDLLDLPLPNFESEINCDPIPFHSKICLEDVSFRFHNEGAWVLKNVNLTISKGERIGIIGKTGSGKSTLLDILMGLMQPVTGNLLVDGLRISGTNVRSWWSHIAQVPQDIFFTDGTIAENIAFGLNANEIDMEKVVQAAEKAQISKTIDLLPDGYLTNIGERGIKLSGGQRQRLGIARALYRNADVIILDEATSALDSETERFVMTSVDGLSKDLTIIVVAHRTSTLKNMDRVFEFSSGHICSIVENVKL